MEGVKRILKYLKATLGKALLFSQNGHMDANWGGSMTNRRSTPGYCTLVGGDLVT